MPEVEGGIAVEEGNESASGSPPVIEGAEEHEEQGKPSKRSQKVKRLSEKLTAAERERDELRTQVQRLQGGRAEQPAGEADKSNFTYPVAKPKADDFQDPAKFVEALTDWKADARDYENARKAEAEEQRIANREREDSYQLRLHDARERYDDFDDAVDNGPTIVFSRGAASLQAWELAIKENEDGPDVLYYIATHPEEVKKFLDLTPAQVATQVGRIAAKLPAQSETEAPPDEKPKPAIIKPVGGSARPAALDRSKLSFQDFKKARKAGKI